MRIAITIDTDNAAFEDNIFELHEIMERAQTIACNALNMPAPVSASLQDTNGHTVGRVEVSEQ